MSAERRGVRGGAREGERFSLSPPPRWRLTLGASLLSPRRTEDRHPNLPTLLIHFSRGQEEGDAEADSPRLGPSPRAATQPLAPGPAGQCAERRPRPRHLLPARCLPSPPSLPAPRRHARPPPPPPPLPPRRERRPHSLAPRALLAAAARASPAAGLHPAERTHPGTRTPAAGRTPAHAPRGSAGRRSRADAPPRAPSPGPATAPRRAPGAPLPGPRGRPPAPVPARSLE